MIAVSTDTDLIAGTGEESGWDEFASVSLWEGDTGTLSFAVRQVLVVMLKNRFITPRSHPREWKTLSDNLAEVRARLNDLFLELVVTQSPEVAFKRQATSEGGERLPTLLHDKAWTREETLVLLKLRDQVRAEVAQGNARAFIERSELLDYVAGFRPVGSTDESGDTDRARNAVANVYKTGLLIGLSTSDRWEISPAVEAMLPMEKLYELLEAFRQHNGRGTQPDTEAGEDDQPAGDERDGDLAVDADVSDGDQTGDDVEDADDADDADVAEDADNAEEQA